MCHTIQLICCFILRSAGPNQSPWTKKTWVILAYSPSLAKIMPKNFTKRLPACLRQTLLGIHPSRASQILPCKSAHFRLRLHILPSDKKCFKSLAETQNPVWGPPKAHHKWPRLSMPWKGQQVPACPHLQDSRIAEIAFIGGNQVAGPSSAHTTKQRTALQLPALLSHSPCNRQNAVLGETNKAGGTEWL